MSHQWIQIGSSWTARTPTETLVGWASRAPAGESGPDGECDHENEWTSGGQTITVCTKCKGDESSSACEARHEEAVEFWEGQKPPE